MGNYLVRRLVQATLLLVGISIIVFVMLRLAPGDPATLLVDPSFFTPQQLREVRESLGLEDPWLVQYAKTMSGLFGGSLRSFRTQEPTIQMVLSAMPTTFSVTFVGLALALTLGVPFGVAAARRPNSLIDRLLSLSIVTAVSFPTFVLALFLIRLFAEEWRILPGSGIRPLGTSGYPLLAMLPHLVLPGLVTAVPLGAILARYTRDAVQEILQEDYVRTAYAKGLAARAVMWRHVLRNVLVTLVSVVGTLTPILLGGSVIVESLFSLPGIGRITVQAALQRDYPVVMTTTLFSAILVIAGNLVTDLAYGIVDPRLRKH